MGINNHLKEHELQSKARDLFKKEMNEFRELINKSISINTLKSFLILHDELAKSIFLDGCWDPRHIFYAKYIERRVIDIVATGKEMFGQNSLKFFFLLDCNKKLSRDILINSWNSELAILSAIKTIEYFESFFTSMIQKSNSDLLKFIPSETLKSIDYRSPVFRIIYGRGNRSALDPPSYPESFRYFETYDDLASNKGCSYDLYIERIKKELYL